MGGAWWLGHSALAPAACAIGRAPFAVQIGSALSRHVCPRCVVVRAPQRGEVCRHRVRRAPAGERVEACDHELVVLIGDARVAFVLCLGVPCACAVRRHLDDGEPPCQHVGGLGGVGVVWLVVGAGGQGCPQ